ncbi:hypothetical protein H4R33_003773 [Dimargaris cristalligena]|nr:hypothetical protein H4R33_003773 [Dimargaris cristalligena]
MSPAALVIAPAFGWSILAAITIGVQCYVTGGAIMKARTKFNVPYPDMGSGRFASKLSDEDWTTFNNIQRGHQNYVEQVSLAQSSVLLSGLFNPQASGILGLTYIIARFFYARGYASKGADGRKVGAMLGAASLLGMVLITVHGSFKLLGCL